MAFSYIQGAELPDIELTWKDSDGAIIDFSSGWTFTLRVGAAGQAAVLTKTTNINGAATAPNIIIVWDSTELNTTAVGSYAMHLIARQTATGKDRILADTLTISAAVLA